MGFFVGHESLNNNSGITINNSTDIIDHSEAGCIKGINNTIQQAKKDGHISSAGEVSDGYHTFNELYHHRALLFASLSNVIPDRFWKSKLHEDGTMFDGMFIVGMSTEEGYATYHYDIDPYWDMFDVKELDKAPEFDGHTPEVALDRIYTHCSDRRRLKNFTKSIGLR